MYIGGIPDPVSSAGSSAVPVSPATAPPTVRDSTAESRLNGRFLLFWFVVILALAYAWRNISLFGSNPDQIQPFVEARFSDSPAIVVGQADGMPTISADFAIGTRTPTTTLPVVAPAVIVVPDPLALPVAAPAVVPGAAAAPAPGGYVLICAYGVPGLRFSVDGVVAAVGGCLPAAYPAGYGEIIVAVQ